MPFLITNFILSSLLDLHYYYLNNENHFHSYPLGVIDFPCKIALKVAVKIA